MVRLDQESSLVHDIIPVSLGDLTSRLYSCLNCQKCWKFRQTLASWSAKYRSGASNRCRSWHKPSIGKVSMDIKGHLPIFLVQTCKYRRVPSWHGSACRNMTPNLALRTGNGAPWDWPADRCSPTRRSLDILINLII